MNNRRFNLLMCLILITGIQISFAQAGNKIHILKKGETLSMLATKYNTTVGDIMRFNSMHQDTKLVVGSKIKIPQGAVAATTNTTQTITKNNPVAKENSSKTVPPKISKEKTHTVKQGETLFAISKIYGVTVDQIKSRNNLKDNNLEEGQQIIIGGNTTSTAMTTVAPAYSQPANDTPGKPATDMQQTAQQNQPVDSAVTQQPVRVDTVANTNNITNNTPATTSPVQPLTNASNTTVNPASVGPEGYFASLFGVDVQQRSLKTIDGVSMTFKTASGWADKKYYILMNDVPPGSIVKVVANSKTIYAKVLWSLGEMKENEGLQFRISNAASAALGIADQKFNISITYYE